MSCVIKSRQKGKTMALFAWLVVNRFGAWFASYQTTLRHTTKRRHNISGVQLGLEYRKKRSRPLLILGLILYLPFRVWTGFSSIFMEGFSDLDQHVLFVFVFFRRWIVSVLIWTVYPAPDFKLIESTNANFTAMLFTWLRASNARHKNHLLNVSKQTVTFILNI